MTSKEQELEQANQLPPTIKNSSDNNEIATNSKTSTIHSSSNSQIKHKSRYTILMRMVNLCKEITLMLLVIITYAALTNEKVSKSPSAYPFFPHNNYVTDWYRGEVTKAIESARTSDVSFVMFYAPWDATSQTIRKEFAFTAKYLHKEVTFAAINCWQPGSECKKQYNKVYRWPVLIAYPIHGRGIQYNGPLDSSHMIKFLQNFCRPLVSVQNINNFISAYDAAIVAKISPLPGSREYTAYYLTALRFLEKDPSNEIVFGVAPQSPDIRPKLSLYLWNETIIYNGKWQPENILNWIYMHLHHITGWMNPSGSKSLSLSAYLQPGPALILFTPKNPFLQHTSYYSMLREIGYEYCNCAKDATITFRQKLIYLNRLRAHMHYQKLRLKCGKKPITTYQTEHSSFTFVPKDFLNSTIKPCEDNCEMCNDCYNLNEICDDRKTLHLSSIKRDDNRSPENLRKYHEENECRNFYLAMKFQTPIFNINTSNNNNTNETSSLDFNITGLACKVNRSLALIAMDSLRYYHFAEKLGIDLFKLKDKTAAVIIDEKMETHYIMDAEFTPNNLRAFIAEYTNGSLERALHPNPHLKSKNTHAYTYQKCQDTLSDQIICVTDLNTENFLPTVLEENRTVIVYYYSKQCAFCSGIAYVFLMVAQFLASIDKIKFVRIDGDLNLLPWEYTMESYPTILYFPPKRKSESRVFPQHTAITVPNLLNFILVNSDSELRLEAMWELCKQSKYKTLNSDCMISLRVETLAVIENTLKQWRASSTRNRPKILHKLQLLRQLHLSVAHLPNQSSTINHYFNKLQSARLVKGEL